MRSVIRKSLSLVLAAVMALTLVSAAFADAFPLFTANEDGTQSITGFDETAVLEDGVLVLEDSLELGDLNLSFTGVSEGAFAYDAMEANDYTAFLETIRELTLDKNIKNIERNAFSALPNLTKVTFKGEVILGEGAFADCPNLTTVVFKGKSELGEKAFAGCDALTSVEFKKDTKVSDTAFSGCTALADIKVSKNATYYGTGASLTDTAFYKGYAVDFITINSTLIYYKGNDYEVTIPENVTEIGLSAFEGNNNLEKVNFTKYIDTLGDRAFYGCRNLTEVNYAGDGEITKVGVDVFTGTPYFEDFEGDFFTIGTLLVKYLGDDADVFIPKTVTGIAPNCFDGCYTAKNPDGYTWVVSAIYVPANITSFGDNCFALAELENGDHYVPRIYAYADTASANALKDLGYTTTSMPRLGDLDEDGTITAADARIALRYAVKLELPKNAALKNATDVDFDELITPSDARVILRIAVKLDCAPEELFNAPVTDFEILMAYTQAMKSIATYGAGYTKTVSNKVVDSDMSAAGKVNLYKTLSTKGYTNETVTYKHDTKEAIENIDFCKLLSTDEIKDAVCEVRDGKYYITIKFNDILDNRGTCDLFKVFPLQKCSLYTSAFEGKSWWTPIYDDDYHANGIKKFDLTYTEPTVTLVCDKDNYQLSECTLSCGYKFAIDGFINLLGISSELYKTGDATLTRQDTITYSDFVYQILDGTPD